MAIEADENGRFVAAAQALDIPVVTGDARQRELLLQLGLQRARAIVAATSSDLVNLSAALNARDLRPDLRVVVRLYDPAFAIRVQRGFGVRFTRACRTSPRRLSPRRPSGRRRGDRRGRRWQVLLFARIVAPTGSALEGRTVGSLDEPAAVRVLAIGDPEAGVFRWRPSAGDRIAPDEEVVAVATRAGLAGLRAGPGGTAALIQPVVAAPEMASWPWPGHRQRSPR